MNKILEEKLIASLDEVQNWVNVSKDFVAEQAPLVVQEIIAWGFYSNLFLTILTTLLCLIFICVLRYFIKLFSRYVEENLSSHDGRWMLPIMGCIVSVICIPVCFGIGVVHAYNTIFVLVAPRLYVLDQLANLLHKVNGGN